MSGFDTDLAETRRALSEGRLGDAEAGVKRLLASRPEDPALARLAAQILKRQGRRDAAKIAYERALAGLPGDAGLHAEYASLLDDLGDGPGAIASYDRALALAPSLIDAAIDRAIVLTRRIDRARGLAELGRIAEANPKIPRAWLTLSLTLRQEGELDAAEAALERALALMPGEPRALRARAQLAFDRGHRSSHLFREARTADPRNRDLDLSEAGALQQEGRFEDAEAFLAAQVADDPAWVGGHYMLAHMRWQRGDGADFARGYRAAIADRPNDVTLWTSLATIIQRALGEHAALDILHEARAAAGEHPAFDNVEANVRCELGELDKAAAFFAGIDRPDDLGLELARIRFLLRDGALDEAARRGLALIERGQGAHAWPYVSAAWRKAGDPRWGWLEGDRDFAKVFDIEALEPELPALAERLRALHLWKVHPFQQSLRGGTQTDNILFSRAEPEIVSLVGHIRRAVRSFIDALPPAEPGHPVLDRPRGAFRFSGSWSVRLTDAGFHVSHIHSKGWISSALYVALPETLGGGERGEDGWLALGEPAPELGLDLPPLGLVEPRPARLVLFPSIMWHGTRPFEAGERLTVAFDVITG